MREGRINNEKKRLLIDSAAKEFAEHGFDNASYNKIIERSGLSKGTVYYYFENKEALLKMVLNEVVEQFMSVSSGLGLPETKEEFWKVDSEYHKRAINFIFESPYPNLLYMLFSDDERINKEMSDNIEKMLCFRYKLIARGQSLGAVRGDMPVETVSKLIQTIGKVLSDSMIKNANGCCDTPKMLEDIKKFAETMRDLSIRILTPSGNQL